MERPYRFSFPILSVLITLLFISAWLALTISKVSAATPVDSQSSTVNSSHQDKLEALVTDLVVDGIEVTQSVQDLKNSIPLVMGKRTFVRVYAHSTSGTWPTTATLGVQLGGFKTTLLPIPPGGAFINVRASYNRLLPSQAFLFEVPMLFTFSNQVTLTATVNPALSWHPHNPEETNYANNSLTKTVSFSEVPPLHLVIAMQPYKFNNTIFTPTALDTWYLVSWIKRAYPINQLKFYFRTLPEINAQRQLNKYGGWDLTYPNCYSVNAYLAYNRAAVIGSPFYPDDMAFYGMVSDAVGFMRGCAPLGGMLMGGINLPTAHVASGPSGSDDWGWDYDGSYADWYGGHELGHSYGLPHTKGGPGYVKDGCGGEAGSWKLYPDGRISPTLNFTDPAAVFGFDFIQLYIEHGNPVRSPWWHDMMTYCNYQWVGGYDYSILKSTLQYTLPLERVSPSNQPQVQDVLAVFGSINKGNGAIFLQPISILYSIPDVTLPSPGNYAIVLRDDFGNLLARYSFTPDGLDGGQARNPDPENQYAYISELVPYVAGTTLVQIEGPAGNVLYQVQAGINPPSIQVTSPVRGSVEDGPTVQVTWNASDPDGDPLTYNVDYSFDNGLTWDAAGLFYTDNVAIIDTGNLPAGDTVQFRVSASDGIHTTQAFSEVFVIPNHLPAGEIIMPDTDITVAVSQTVTFEAQVYDVELGNMDGTDIEWYSSIDGFIGNGAVFTTETLSVGAHVITMRAADGQGGVVLDTVTVVVVPTPNELPAQPDELTAGPDLIFLQPYQGFPSATVYVDNLNLWNSITWTAYSDQPWLLLSADSGITPQDFDVSTNLSPRDFGTHTANIILTSPDAPGTHVTLNVIVTLPVYHLYSPIMLK